MVGLRLDSRLKVSPIVFLIIAVINILYQSVIPGIVRDEMSYVRFKSVAADAHWMCPKGCNSFF